jgi:hypothetical protein
MERERDSDTALFGDLGDWGVEYACDDGEVSNDLESTNIHHKLHHPHGKRFDRPVPNDSVTPAAHMERVSSFANRSTDSCDDFLESIGLAAHACPTMSDEEFEALLDWSDVEDDPDFE